MKSPIAQSPTRLTKVDSAERQATASPRGSYFAEPTATSTPIIRNTDRTSFSPQHESIESAVPEQQQARDSSLLSRLDSTDYPTVNGRAPLNSPSLTGSPSKTPTKNATFLASPRGSIDCESGPPEFEAPPMPTSPYPELQGAAVTSAALINSLLSDTPVSDSVELIQGDDLELMTEEEQRIFLRGEEEGRTRCPAGSLL